MNNDKHARTRALFERAVAAIAALPASAAPNESISLSNQQLLHFYSLYKQATQGDLPTSSLRRPGLFDLRGRAKYDAWLARQGTPQHVAMRQYVDLFMAFLRKFPD
ncbi:acyl-CoA-binding protein, partial [Catenaria anguillulae PL171]